MKRVGYRLKLGLITLSLLSLMGGCAPDDDQGALFQDDFGRSQSGWGRDRRDEFSRGYADGEYFFEIEESNWFAWAHPGGQFEDVSVEVDAYLASGALDGHFGVLCRYVDLDNFYYLAISADGYYAIFRMTDGEFKILTGSGMAQSSAIRTGQQTNRVLAVCRGDELSLFANGTLLATVTDDAHDQGDVGLGAGSGPGGIFRVQFDDFIVTEP